jgi:hypothetical protein
MITLPDSNRLPVGSLAAGFDNVTNSYKFYWFLAILEQVQKQPSRFIQMETLLAGMLASVWYPTNYFRLSFGKQDRLGQLALLAGTQAGVAVNARRKDLFEILRGSLTGKTDLARSLQSLGEYVPYRFLRPFFAMQLQGLKDADINAQIESLAGQSFDDPVSPCLYRFTAAGIELQPLWFDYLQRNLAILTGFCLWRLVNHLQKHNPNVPNLSNKLFEPAQRDLKAARLFWAVAAEPTGSLPCIYSGQSLEKGAYSLDHFLPWRFVAHDLLWNILPTPKSINSSKSDSLPDLDLYFEPFAELQYQAVQTVAGSSRARLLEDHTLLLRVSSLAELRGLSKAAFREALHAALAPQVQIAANLGFEGPWRHR